MAYTTIDDPSAYFQTALYAGNNTTDHNITNDGNSDLQPDFVWIKQRTSDNPHVLHDTSRGFNGSGLGFNLQTNSTAAEGTNGAFESFNTNGFGVGGTNVASGAYNLSGSNYVAWQWKANGGTTASNTDGSTTSTVQADTTAGFSIITWTGTGSATTLGHGLGVAPDVLIVKNRSTSVDWAVYHQNMTDAGYTLALNTTDGQLDSGTNRWNHTAPTSSVFSIGSGQQTNQNTNNMICYAFAEKQGYSKFGKYVGNGNSNGPFVYTGFKPAFVMIKNASATESWAIYDNKRSPDNPADLKLSSDTADGENDNSAIGGTAYNNIDILSNGFKCKTNNAATNGSGNTLIYMAFAENPFVTSTGVPATAR